MSEVLGILVNGDNHFIVSGPCPDCPQALWIVRQWSVIQIGDFAKAAGWEICTKAFREELEWAVVVPNPRDHSPAVRQLLEEMSARGISIQRC